MNLLKNRAVAWVLTVLTAAGCLGYGYLKRPVPLPEPQRGVYVMDAADVLSPETEQAVLSYDRAWEENYNSVLAVATVDSTRGWELYDCTNTIKQNWHLSDNDSILLIDVGGDTFNLSLGYGIYDKANTDVIYDAEWTSFGPALERGNYDGGVTSLLDTVNTAYTEKQGGQSVDLDDYFDNFGTEQNYNYNYEYSYGNNYGNYYDVDAEDIASLVFLAVAAFVVLAIIDKARFRNWTRRGNYSYGFRPIVFWHSGSWVKKMERRYERYARNAWRAGPPPSGKSVRINTQPGRTSRPAPPPQNRSSRVTPPTGRSSRITPPPGRSSRITPPPGRGGRK